MTDEQIKQAAEEFALSKIKDKNRQPDNDIYFAARTAYEAGANFGREIGMKEAFEWIDVNNRNVMMPEAPILLKLENGEIRRYDEDFESEFPLVMVTHWRPINFEDFINLQK